MKPLLIILAAVLLSGCVSVGKIQKLDASLKAFAELGIEEVVITGKVSHTQYKVTREEGQRVATLEHGNPWTPRIYIVRRTQ
jgi:ABC-type Fe3+-hydroxamate transport system substrate-binding protein